MAEIHKQHGVGGPVNHAMCFATQAAHAEQDDNMIVVSWCFMVFLQGMVLSAVNGVGLALVIPNAQSITADYYDELDRGKAFGALYMTSALGGAFGSLYATNQGQHLALGSAVWWCYRQWTARNKVLRCQVLTQNQAQSIFWHVWVLQGRVPAGNSVPVMLAYSPAFRCFCWV